MVKDISNLKDRNIKDIIAVDDNLTPFSHCLQNLVPILPFHNNREDKELLKLATFLEYLHDLDDHMDFLDDYFKLSSLMSFGSAEEALKYHNPAYGSLKSFDKERLTL